MVPGAIVLSGKLSDLWTIWQLRRNLVILVISLMSSSFCYFLINFQMKQFEGSLITNTLSSQIAELLADIISMFLYRRLGAKLAFSSMFMFSVVGAALLWIFHTQKGQRQNPVLLIFIFMSKFGVSSCFNSCYLGFVQLIPTLYSSSAFGYGNVVARTITILAPLIAEKQHPYPLLAIIIMASIAALASAFLITKMP